MKSDKFFNNFIIILLVAFIIKGAIDKSKLIKNQREMIITTYKHGYYQALVRAKEFKAYRSLKKADSIFRKDSICFHNFLNKKRND